jgi:glutaredoxin-like protein NrdH
MSICVYSRPSCVQCKATVRYLGKNGIEFKVIDISEDSQAREFVSSLGYSSVPVVVTSEGDHWGGFRLDKINSLPRAAA